MILSRKILAAFACGITSSSLAPIAAQEAMQYEEVGSWYVVNNVDPFTDAGLIHLALTSDETIGVMFVALNCNAETQNLWLRVGHSYMIGDDDSNEAFVRFGSAPPQTLRGTMASDNSTTDFTIKWSDVVALEQDPNRFAVRFTDLGDGDSYDFVRSNLQGTQDALAMLSPCRPK